MAKAEETPVGGLPDDRNAEALLKRLEWTVLRRLDGLLQGDYRTLMRGAGLDLADLREYQHHDDVRHIDWNVTARLQQPYVRQFTEDRELAAWFLVDLSAASTSARTASPSGASRATSSPCWRASSPATATGSAPSSTATRSTPSCRRAAAACTCSSCCSGWRDGRPNRRPGSTDLRDLLTAGQRQIKRRSSVFVVSDFISAPGWEQALGQLALRHEVTAVRLFDALEMDLPDIGLITMRDAETGEQLLVDTHNAGFASASRPPPSGARRRCAKASPGPASTPSSSPPTTTWSTPSCASPI
jgi:uncharacterized protein (DUF58 family)